NPNYPRLLRIHVVVRRRSNPRVLAPGPEVLPRFFARRPYKPAYLTAHPHFTRGSRCGGKVRASGCRSPCAVGLMLPGACAQRFGFMTAAAFEAVIVYRYGSEVSKTKLHF